MNPVSKLGLVLITAALSALAGNIFTLQGPGLTITYSTGRGLGPQKLSGIYLFLKSYEYRVTISCDGKALFMVLRLEDLLSSAGSLEEKALIKKVVEGWSEVSFRPERRGAYALLVKNLEESRLSASFAVFTTKVLEVDFLMDTMVAITIGVFLVVIGLTLNAVSQRRLRK